MKDQKKILYIGGVKSGKSKLAEKRTLELSSEKPIYLATSEIFDEEMRKKVREHQIQRGDNFKTREEPLEIKEIINSANSAVLVECMTIWINNMIYYKKSDKKIIEDVKTICDTNKTIVFVMNETGLGVLPENKLARHFVNLSGLISQIIAESCSEVHYCVAGLSFDLKKQAFSSTS